MAKRYHDRATYWRLAGSYVTTVISIALVLFVLAMVGLLVFNARILSDLVRESIAVTVIFDENTPENHILYVQKEIDRSVYCKATNYITKEEAALMVKKELGDDFVNFLGYNPLLSSIDVNIKAAYTHPDSIAAITKQMATFERVHEVAYEPSLVEIVNKNVTQISGIILVFALLLFVMSIVLINNTIRLSLISRRFIIKTMQLVGATDVFIRRPFVMQGVYLGLIGSGLAVLLTFVMTHFIESAVEQVFTVNFTLLVALLTIFCGVLFTVLSSYLAVGRYLRMNRDELYYQ